MARWLTDRLKEDSPDGVGVRAERMVLTRVGSRAALMAVNWAD